MMQVTSTTQGKPTITILDAVKGCLRKYAGFSGRAARPEFWWWALVAFIACVALKALEIFIINEAVGHLVVGLVIFSPVATIFFLAILMPSLAVAARRLHDIGKAGWWILGWSLMVLGAWVILLVVDVLPLANYIFGEGWNVGDAELRSARPFATFAPAISGIILALMLNFAVLIWAMRWLSTPGGAAPNRFGDPPLG